MRLVCTCLLILLSTSASADALVIERVTVIDATGKPAQPDMTVVIEQGRIAAIGRSKKVKVPANSQLVEGGGKFVIPGLWDMHVHGYATPDGGLTWTYPLYLANGVVGVRDMFGPEDANTWRAQHAKYDGPSPNVYLGSPIIDGPKPVWPGAVGVADAAQARAAVDRDKGNGADLLLSQRLRASPPHPGALADVRFAQSEWQVPRGGTGCSGSKVLIRCYARSRANRSRSPAWPDAPESGRSS